MTLADKPSDMAAKVERADRQGRRDLRLAALDEADPEDPGPSEPDDYEAPRETARPSAPAAHLRYPALDWQRVFDGAPDDIDWLVPDFIARGQSYSLVSPAKAGKSLLMLDVAAAIAAGRSPLGHPAQPPVRVLYVDCENSRDDLVERLRDMGYGPHDLAALRYLSFPSLPALDSPAGGAEAAALAEHHDVALVVIDTIARVVAGEENSADTYRNLYRYTLQPLKAQQRAVVRLDHRGKGVNAGARGSSAKNDDVDVVWQLNQSPGPDGEAYVTLRLERQRGSAHPEQINVLRDVTPRLRHVAKDAPLAASEQQRVGECIEAMKLLGLPADVGRPKALKALREAGYKVRSDTVMAAVKARKAAKNCPEADGGSFGGLFS
ncbi:AAA family ATPase [Mycobacterium europaeum]|uniref:AAA family ATPase n=1 Tax=Mycobacterium europaeum TaxID=761804 RepID=UPI002ADFEEA2|nr:AAA family ATPase [Mycobacterium europaeum]MEA1160660.1 AAA family ATPase [Mycobacterium europaeum]